MVPYADLILPDTTYLERWDCISLLDRPISEPDGPADAIRQPVVAPDRDVRPFQDVLIDLGAPAEAAGHRQGGRLAEVSRRLSRLHRQPRAQARHRPAGRLSRRERRRRSASGEPNPHQLEPLHRRRLLPRAPPAAHMRYFKHVNRDYIEWAVDMGLRLTPHAGDLPALQRADAEDAPGRARPRRRAAARAAPRAASRPTSIRCRSGIRRSRAPRSDAARIPHARHHAAADGDVPLLGLAERVAAADPWRQPAVHEPRARRRSSASPTTTGCGSPAASAACRAQVKLMEGVNADTVWTWNAIGKRAGAWALDADAPEATRGFLLNHLIAELLPEQAGGYRYLQQRSRHRPGRLVRPARAHREGAPTRRRPRPRRASRRCVSADRRRAAHPSPTSAASGQAERRR